jgi:UDP-2,4-diacetamido-2,4,6-trideoxy-beta-L-altropyranose hydrolase
MKIIFRTDASLYIGNGHLVRCLNLARSLKKLNAECIFICRDFKNKLFENIRKENFKLILLPIVDSEINKKIKIKNESSYFDRHKLNWQHDAEETIEALDREQIDLLIIDHYEIDTKWEKKLRQYSKKIMVIDDLNNRNHDCDFFLNQNLGSSEILYQELLPSKCKQFHGPKFALLNPIYSLSKLKLINRLGKINRTLIYFGGSNDSIKLTEITIEIFSDPELINIKLDIVINSDIDGLFDIEKIASKRGLIEIHHDLPNLAKLMLNADLAIGAGGSTTWERCAMGLPSIIVVSAENQKLSSDNMSSLGAAYVFYPNKNLKTQIKNSIIKLQKNINIYKNMSNQALSICDGNGAERISEIILKDYR